MTLLNSIVFYRLRSKAIVFGSVLAVSALGQFQAPVDGSDSAVER